MAVAFRSATAPVFGGTVNPSTVTVTKPAGTVSGDVLLAQIQTGASEYVAGTSAPTGWSLVRTDTGGTQIYSKVAGGAEPASYVFSNATGNVNLVGGMVTYSGAVGVHAHAGFYSTSSTILVAPSATVRIPASHLVLFGTAYSGASATPPSGATERYDTVPAGTTFGMEVSDLYFVGTGSTTVPNGAWSASTTAATQLVALDPANVAPNAPTLTTMAAGGTINRAVSNRASHLFSDNDAGDSQSAFNMWYRLVGGSAWTSIPYQLTTNQFYDFPAASLAAGSYERQVETFDADGVASPRSASGFFTAADAPAGPTITDPASGVTITTATRTFTFSHPGFDSSEFRVLGDLAGSADTGNVIVAIMTGTAAGRTFTATNLPNSVTIHPQVRVITAGLASAWADSSNPVSFTPPATPTLTVGVNTAAGALTVTAAHPTPGAGQPAVTSVVVHRRVVGDTGDGIRVAAGILPLATFTDYTVASGVDYAYRVRAYGANGTSSYSLWSAVGTPLLSYSYGGAYS